MSLITPRPQNKASVSKTLYCCYDYWYPETMFHIVLCMKMNYQRYL